MSKRWFSERQREHYHLRAKEEGYRSRAAFKLIQIDKRFNFLKEASKVLDLGAAPGGWLQAASQLMGDEGLILGVDLQEISPTGLPGVETLVGDMTSEATIREIRRKSGRHPFRYGAGCQRYLGSRSLPTDPPC
jgi:23S rRNA (uridine2552-2'-O)-methyltransferase